MDESTTKHWMFVLYRNIEKFKLSLSWCYGSSLNDEKFLIITQCIEGAVNCTTDGHPLHHLVLEQSLSSMINPIKHFLISRRKHSSGTRSVGAVKQLLLATPGIITTVYRQLNLVNACWIKKHPATWGGKAKSDRVFIPNHSSTTLI